MKLDASIALLAEIVVQFPQDFIVIYLLTYGAEPFMRSRHLCGPSRTSQNFMEPEGSMPCSEEPSTSPYREPYPSNQIYLVFP
jgi:hypothetical protein